MTPTEVVSENLAAYNARELERFMESFADDIEIVDQATGEVTMRGLAEVRTRYGALFEASPALHSEIVQRTALGQFVVDLEKVTGRAGGDLDILITYQVVAGKIRRTWLVRQPR